MCARKFFDACGFGFRAGVRAWIAGKGSKGGAVSETKERLLFLTNERQV